MGYRNVVITVGVLLSGVVAPLLAGDDDYTRMSLLLGVGMLAALLAGIFGVPRLHRAAPGAAPVPERSSLLTALRDRQFRALAAAYLVMAVTMSLVLAAVPYFARYELGRPGLTSLLVAAFMTPAVLTTPVWVLAARRFGKQRSLLTAQAAFVAGALATTPGSAAGLPLLLAAMAVLGVAFAGMQLMPLSMLPDIVAASSTAGAGRYTGVWTAAEATGSAIGPYVYSACLAAGGFVAATADAPVTQSPTALAAVRYGFALVPAALAVLLQTRYTLDRTAAPTAPEPQP